MVLKINDTRNIPVMYKRIRLCGTVVFLLCILDSYAAIVGAAVTGDAWTGHNAQLDEDVNRLRGLMRSLCGICDVDVGWQCDGHSAPDH